MRPAAQPAPALALALVVGLGMPAGGCRTRPSDCRHAQTERCLWERGVTSPTAGTPDGGEADPDGSVDADEASPITTKLDDAIAQMTAIIAAGLEWPLIDEQARTLCGELPRPPELDPALPPPTEGAWTCGVVGLELGEQPLTLEASDGVLALSAVDLDDAASAALFDLAQRRFTSRCATQAFDEVEGDGLAEYHRCSLADGPYLVVARFPRDLEATRWQVSIAVVDAG